MQAMTPLVQGIAPRIGQMQDMMKNMDGNGEGGLGGVMEIAKKLAASTNQ
jgi:hypothetical protein